MMGDDGRWVMAERRHPGINMHKLEIGSGFVAFLFTVGCALIFLVGLPALWYFVAFSAAFGVAVALILHALHRRRRERMKPLSILHAGEKAQSAPPASRRVADQRLPNKFASFIAKTALRVVQNLLGS
jgi:hypothetical protein